MAAPKVVYYCGNCGANSAKWVGKCPSCNEWNTFSEEVVHKEKKTKVWYKDTDRSAQARPFSSLETGKERRPFLVEVCREGMSEGELRPFNN